MNELRRDPLTGTWVAIAADRQGRLSSFLEDENDDAGSCPFCPGNEGLTPPEITRVDDENGNWLDRVIPNRYPIFCREAQPDGLRDSRLFLSLPGLGSHEVIIETPDHDRDLADVSPDQAVAVVETYATRVAELLAAPHAGHVSVFRNRGKSAGASLAHPHTQVVATAAVPDGVWKRIERERRYHGEAGRCLVCDLLQAAARDQRRASLRTHVARRTLG